MKSFLIYKTDIKILQSSKSKIKQSKYKMLKISYHILILKF